MLTEPGPAGRGDGRPAAVSRSRRPRAPARPGSPSPGAYLPSTLPSGSASSASAVTASFQALSAGKRALRR